MAETETITHYMDISSNMIVISKIPGMYHFIRPQMG
jgi:hypothetical protein